MKRVIFHVDVNSAFLSWEACYRLHHLGGKQDLREIVSAVGGDQEKRHGIILAKSISVKKYHIQTGETVVSAKQKCPELVLVPPNYDLYNRSSKALIRMLGDYTDRIEQYSIDEAFLDMTGCCSDPEEKAHEMRKRIRNELGFTVNIGISENKLLAKMASDFAKPDRVHTLWRHEIPKKMWPLPVGDLFYVGHPSLKKLSNLGIRTIGELAAMDPALLRGHMKSHVQLIWQYANGLDDSPVIDIHPAAKGYGNSLTDTTGRTGSGAGEKISSVFIGNGFRKASRRWSENKHGFYQSQGLGFTLLRTSDHIICANRSYHRDLCGRLPVF